MSLRWPRRPGALRQGGFTLLEVMVALMILAMSLTIISQAQSNGVTAVGRAKQMTIATMLARWKMVEIEDDLFEEGFSDFEEEDKGDFAEQDFKSFSYTVKTEKVELPTNLDAAGLKDAASGGEQEEGAESPMSGIFAMGAKMMQQQFEIFRNVLEQSIRRVTVRVSWKEGTRERYISVMGYFTDPRKIDSVAGGTLHGQTPPGQTPPGQTPPGQTPPGQPAPPPPVNRTPGGRQ